MSGRSARKKRSRRDLYLVAVLVAAVVIAGTAALLYHPQPGTPGSSSGAVKPMILYINQGNGAVNGTNFQSMLSFASSHGFNTIFFQVYREGVLLFNTAQLSTFVAQSHAAGMKVFFALYITNASQTIPTSIYPLHEDGINLDMSTLPLANQSTLLSTLQSGYNGTTAMTTTDLTLPLHPDILVLETYTSDIQDYSQYLQPGIVGSVGAFATTSYANYQQEYQYVLAHTDGVMVFDYAGLMKSGY